MTNRKPMDGTGHIPVKDVAAVVEIFRDIDVPPHLRRKVRVWAEMKLGLEEDE